MNSEGLIWVCVHLYRSGIYGDLLMMCILLYITLGNDALRCASITAIIILIIAIKAILILFSYCNISLSYRIYCYC